MSKISAVISSLWCPIFTLGKLANDFQIAADDSTDRQISTSKKLTVNQTIMVGVLGEKK
jgi:hypothetical protein